MLARFRDAALPLLGSCLLLGAPATGCGAPIEGERLEHLRRDVRDARLPAILVRSVGPRDLVVGGDTSDAVMPLISHGTEVAAFRLYDLYFKLAFVAVEELRALGFDAVAAPRIWTARAEVIALDARALAPDVLDVQLARLGAQEDVPQLYKLDRVRKVDLLVSRRVLLSARTALPLRMRAKPAKKAGGAGKAALVEPTGREIRDSFFLAEGAREPPLALDIELLSREVVAEEGTFGAERRARVELGARFTEAGEPGRLLAEGTYAAGARAQGTGATLEGGARYTFVLGEDDPLERAIRRAIRAAVEGALPALRAIGSPSTR